MKLFLLRHSESVQENDTTNDFNRTLSINGNNEANLLANFILRRKLNFNKVLCSSSIRTIQTLNILIENNNVDVILHISTLNPNKVKLNKNIYNIVIGHPNSVFDHKPDIFIPVGIPGIDYDGIMFRTDNVVSVALKNIRDIKLPTTENIINQLN